MASKLAKQQDFDNAESTKGVQWIVIKKQERAKMLLRKRTETDVEGLE